MNWPATACLALKTVLNASALRPAQSAPLTITSTSLNATPTATQSLTNMTSKASNAFCAPPDVIDATAAFAPAVWSSTARWTDSASKAAYSPTPA